MFEPIKRFVVAAIVVLAASGPSVAYAMPKLDPGAPASTQPQRIDQLARIVPGRFASEGGRRVAASSVNPSVNSQDGFQWDDAGIGAATILILLGGGIVASVAVRRRRASGAAVA
jgi:hypothetical protein